MLVSLVAGVAQADPREDFLAGRTKACAGCDLTGANFKRRDLTGADLTEARGERSVWLGTKLHEADLTEANLPRARRPSPRKLR